MDFFVHIADDRYGWSWLFVSVPCIVISWFWTAHVRKGQLERWSLASSVVAPSMLSHVLMVTVVLGARRA
jgi:hypothetical protein